MDKAFWLEVWENNQLGFHQFEYHVFLEQYFDAWVHQAERAGLSNRAIFVPLCGKSLDMHFLAQRMQVIGSELSEKACEDFYAEAGIEAQKENITEQASSFVRWKGKSEDAPEEIEIWEGDYFSLPPSSIQQCQLIYDRASLIALPESMQKDYVEKLRTLFPKGTQLFLVTLEYPKGEMEGPPHRISQPDVSRLFSWASRVECVERADITGEKFGRRRFDVSELVENLFFITF